MSRDLISQIPCPGVQTINGNFVTRNAGAIMHLTDRDAFQSRFNHAEWQEWIRDNPLTSPPEPAIRKELPGPAACLRGLSPTAVFVDELCHA